MAEGWKCPGCGRFYGPHVDECRRCEPGASPAARPQVVQEAAKPTVAKLWDEFAPWGKRNFKAGSWVTMTRHLAVYKRTRVPVGEGGALVSDLPWDALTTQFAELYREVREGQTNRRGGTVKPSTVNRELTTLQSMLRYFVDFKKTIPRSPIDGFHRADERAYARQTYLSPDEVRRFIEAGHPLFQDICWTAYRCVGMRHSEARLLRKSEIDWEARIIKLPASRNKNAAAREIPFPQDVETILRRHCESSRGPFVFVAVKDPRRCKPVPGGTMQHWLVAARKNSGVKGFSEGEDVVIHTLRHSGVTQLIQDGGKEGFVRAAAGMSPQTFARYLKFGRAQQDDLRKVMERSIQPPTSITAELDEPRKEPKRPGAPLLALTKASDE